MDEIDWWYWLHFDIIRGPTGRKRVIRHPGLDNGLGKLDETKREGRVHRVVLQIRRTGIVCHRRMLDLRISKHREGLPKMRQVLE